jgi:hypothetical protein
MVSMLKSWQYQNGAQMYMLAVWGDLEKGPCGFEYVPLMCSFLKANTLPAMPQRIAGDF